MRTNSGASVTKVRAFVVDESGSPRSGVAVALRNKGAIVAILQSDHAGFVSFLAPGKVGAPGDLTAHVLNAQLPATAVGIDAPVLLTVPRDVALPAAPQWMPSVASPDAGDRELSPNSFGSVTSAAVGDGACQTLLPGVLPEHSYEIRQLIPFLRDTGKIQKAYLFIYNVRWFPVGHALGDLIYTLPLAPGESTNVAVVDWARQDTAGRVDSAQIDESLVHELGRDRTIDDTMNATLNERQNGWSFMTALAGQYNGGQYSIAGSSGGAYSESTGFRDLSSNAMQTVADRITQNSSAQRRMTTSVVVQANQAEQTSLSTRTITNHNHCHTLTILYYGVLRQFRVVTSMVEAIPALLIEYQPAATAQFTDEQLLGLRYLLEPLLLDPSLAPGFNAIADSFLPPDPPAPPQEVMISSLTVTITSEALPNECSAATRVRMSDASTQDILLRGIGDPQWDRGSHTVTWSLAPRVERGAIAGVQLLFYNHQSGTVGDLSRNWSVSALTIDGRLADGTTATIFHTALSWQPGIASGRPTPAAWPSDVDFASVPPPPAAQPAANSTPRDRALAALLLKNHIRQNLLYYNRAAAMGQDPDARALQMLDIVYNGRPLLEQIDTIPIGSFGNMLAYPWLTKDTKLTQPTIPDPTVRWVSLPTRGVFAESQLGKCEACEEIDDTRFWDWQTSPIPESPPPITDVSAASRAEQNIPTAGPNIPPPVINIQNAPTEPDPGTGMAALLTAITTSNAFRDMSGREQLAALMQTLAQSVRSGAASGGSGGSGTTSSTGASGAVGGATLSQSVGRNLSTLQQAQQRGQITPQQQQTANSHLLSNNYGGSPQSYGAPSDPTTGTDASGNAGGTPTVAMSTGQIDDPGGNSPSIATSGGPAQGADATWWTQGDA